MAILYIVCAIEYLMYVAKAPWWAMAIFGALMVADLVNYMVNIFREKEHEDEKRDI